jgi:hypothetical protein
MPVPGSFQDCLQLRVVVLPDLAARIVAGCVEVAQAHRAVELADRQCRRPPAARSPPPVGGPRAGCQRRPPRIPRPAAPAAGGCRCIPAPPVTTTLAISPPLRRHPPKELRKRENLRKRETEWEQPIRKPEKHEFPPDFLASSLHRSDFAFSRLFAFSRQKYFYPFADFRAFAWRPTPPLSRPPSSAPSEGLRAR